MNKKEAKQFVKENYPPLKKRAIKRLNQILDLIKFIPRVDPYTEDPTDYDEPTYMQGSWHCGTSHCFFGWHVHLTLVEAGKVPMNFEYVGSERTMLEALSLTSATTIINNPVSESGIRDFSMRSLGLNDAEFSYIALVDNGIEEIEHAVTALSSGKRRFRSEWYNQEQIIERLIEGN